MRAALQTATAIVLWATVVAVPRAIERMPLPQFPLTQIDGQVVSSTRLIRDGRWLIVFVPVGCQYCEALLALAAQPELQLDANRFAFVVGGASAKDVEALAEKFASLPQETWFADPSGISMVPLQLGNTPALIGVEGGRIEWGLTGVLAASDDVRAVMVKWLGMR